MGSNNSSHRVNSKTPPHSPPAVELNQVSKHYPHGEEILRAVDKVSLVIDPGDFAVITGRSGSGKTTLLSLIGGLTNPTAGEIKIFGRALSQLDDTALSELRAAQIGFGFQFPSLIPTLTTIDNLRLPGLFSNHPVSLRRAQELLSWVGLADKHASYPSQLSGGQQARIALARAFANQPSILLADEPTGNLDVETEFEMMELIQEINQTQHTTVLLVTHNPELASFGSQHFIMDQGKMAAKQPTPKLEVVPDG